MTIYLDTHLDERARRERLYGGDIFVYSPRPTTRALTDFARQLIEEAFAPLAPEQAQFELPVERFVEIVAPLKPRFIHHPQDARAAARPAEPTWPATSKAPISMCRACASPPATTT